MYVIRTMIAASIAILAIPAFAADNSMSGGSMTKGGSMMMEGGSMSMMKGGEVIAIMPDGHMGTAKMSEDKAMSTAKMSAPMKGCMMFINTADGHTMMVDTSSEAAQAECEKIAK